MQQTLVKQLDKYDTSINGDRKSYCISADYFVLLWLLAVSSDQ